MFRLISPKTLHLDLENKMLNKHHKQNQDTKTKSIWNDARCFSFSAFFSFFSYVRNLLYRFVFLSFENVNDRKRKTRKIRINRYKLISCL